ncbi:hypothetical protein D9619_009059 [Psilocybe cf. subviscida]|uniref:DUF6534 domain-containing protein n=1 Tax=Psilocybe cf. subviscida TaxID=2480587 RepID=A0A8H5BV75_9AGAR|nr:hypothetical protein D9619_009059 [Psilocybe cf. subviscida]
MVMNLDTSSVSSVSRNILIADKFAIAVKVFVVTIALLALGESYTLTMSVTVSVWLYFILQLSELDSSSRASSFNDIDMKYRQKIQVIHSFAAGFEYIIFLGFGTTALVDCSIAAAMCLILYKSNAGTAKSESVLESLIQYFIGSGLLTSFASILCIVLYIAQPDTLLYLGMEFSVTRLYANSLLAISNGRSNLRKKLDEDMSLRIPCGVFFVEPDQMGLMHGLKDPFSPDMEMKFGGRDVDEFSNSSYTKQGATLSRQSSSRSHTV